MQDCFRGGWGVTIRNDFKVQQKLDLLNKIQRVGIK
jgi:hypothetical protein